MLLISLLFIILTTFPAITIAHDYKNEDYWNYAILSFGEEIVKESFHAPVVLAKASLHDIFTESNYFQYGCDDYNKGHKLGI